MEFILIPKAASQKARKQKRKIRTDVRRYKVYKKGQEGKYNHTEDMKDGAMNQKENGKHFAICMSFFIVCLFQ